MLFKVVCDVVDFIVEDDPTTLFWLMEGNFSFWDFVRSHDCSIFILIFILLDLFFLFGKLI